MINVLIADDHVIMRNGLKQLCEVMGDVVVLGEAANGAEVKAQLNHSSFDLILLDLTMPDVTGVDLIEYIHQNFADQPILVFSMHNEPMVAKRALRAGASGFISKGGPQDILVSAIRSVATGSRFIDPLIAEQVLFDGADATAPQTLEVLSKRENQILKMLAQGKSVNTIADELFISSKTVSTYKARLMQKMNFKSNAELIIYASENGLIVK